MIDNPMRLRMYGFRREDPVAHWILYFMYMVGAPFAAAFYLMQGDPLGFFILGVCIFFEVKKPYEMARGSPAND